jgi:hypothetical protein
MNYTTKLPGPAGKPGAHELELVVKFRTCHRNGRLSRDCIQNLPSNLRKTNVMKNRSIIGSLILSIIFSLTLFAEDNCVNGTDCPGVQEQASMLGWFDKSKDLFLPQFDSKTDVDDIHTVAAVGTMLSDPRFSEVKFHAVAGAYGTQGGEYVPAPALFDMVFGSHWSDAHGNYKSALKTVTGIAVETLGNGGDIWIAEAGQSDFSADLVRQVKMALPGVDTRACLNHGIAFTQRPLGKAKLSRSLRTPPSRDNFTLSGRSGVLA